MCRIFPFLIVCAISFVMGPGVPLFAEIYQWEDSQGTPHFTDDLSQVPPSQREDARAVPLPEPSGPQPGTVSAPPADQPPPEPLRPVDATSMEEGGPEVPDPYEECMQDMKALKERLEKELARDEARLDELNKLIHLTGTARRKNQFQRERVQVKERIEEARRREQEDLPRMEEECRRQRRP